MLTPVPFKLWAFFILSIRSTPFVIGFFPEGVAKINVLSILISTVITPVVIMIVIIRTTVIILIITVNTVIIIIEVGQQCAFFLRGYMC